MIRFVVRRTFSSAARLFAPIAALCACLIAGEAAAQAPEIKIAFVGDSMSDGIWGGIVRMTTLDSCLRGHFDLGRYGNNGSGLTRPDRFDWPEEVKKIEASFHPDLFVVSLGLNDRQFLMDVSAGRTHVDFGTPEWDAKYSEQVKQLLQNASPAKAGVLWVGIPVMREAAANTDATEKNKLYSDAIQAFGDAKVQYLAPWRLNPNGPEVFKSIGPGREGSIVQLRAPDGIHFTSAGYDVLASYIYPKIVEKLQQNQISVPPGCGK